MVLVLVLVYVVVIGKKMVVRVIRGSCLVTSCYVIMFVFYYLSTSHTCTILKGKFVDVCVNT